MAVITISRGTMSGGEALARQLSGRLGWPAVSREVITETAEKHGVSEKIVAEQLTKGPGWLKRYTAERRLYLVAVESALIERALLGSYIYHGYAGHLLLKGIPGVFKVRLIAPMEFRVRNVMERMGMSREAGIRYIQQVDRQRVEWTRFLYDVDWSDPAIYDAVFNLSTLSVDTVADIICQAVRSPEFQDTPESRKAIEQAALACKIKSLLAQHHTTRGLDMQVTVREGTVRVTGNIVTGGIMHSGVNMMKEDIRRIASSVPGVTDVEVEVSVTPLPIE